MINFKRPRLMLLGLFFLTTLAAAEYPDKAVKFVVPFPPGGSFDGPARLLTARLTKLSGQPFVVETRSGAGGAVGAAEVSRAVPDGYTALLSNGAMPVSATLTKKPLFDAVTGFTHVATFGVLPFVVVVNPKLPFNTLQEFIEASRKEPGKYNYASAGNGSAAHLGAEQIKQAFGVNWVHVPYRGTGPALTDLLAGQVNVTVVGLSSAIGHIKAGTLKALAVTSATRLAQLPNVPTVAEIKPNFTIETWIGVAMPPKAPADAVNRMAALVEQAMKDNDLRAQLRELAVEPVFEGPAAAKARMAKDVSTFTELGKGTSISLD
jgi:tripartite-type tricarboxylate transporter receptor subunit TctC